MFDSCRVDMAQGGTTDGTGRIEDAYVTNTTVVYRQAYKGIRSINNNHGLLMLTFDNDGTLTHLHDSTRPVAGTTSHPARTLAQPAEKGRSEKIGLMKDDQLEAAFARQLQVVLGHKNATEMRAVAQPHSVVDETRGYDFSAATGELVASREYQVEHGNVENVAIEKLHRVRVPLLG